MTRRVVSIPAAALIALALAVAPVPAAKQKKGIPAHPSKIKYPALDFEVPDAEAYRHQLSNGIPVYIAEDHDLPLVSISITARVGEFLDAADAPGVSSMTGTMMRQGGTRTQSAEAFDERADFLAANIGAFSGSTSGGASLNCITPVLDESLDLLFDMLKNPGFDEARLAIQKDNYLESMKQRNDDAGDIQQREWTWLIRGEDHFTGRQMTSAELEAISGEKLAAFHKSYWRPDGMIISVSGDVETEKILAELEKRFAGWEPKGPEVSWPPAPPTHTPVPGLYHVEKDIPQGKVNIGHLSVRWDDWGKKEYYAAQIMNDILGGGGFTSRMVKRIRSDEGLAYSAGSRFGIGTFWPATFRVSYQSKNETVALAAKIALDLIDQIRTEPVSDEELKVSKNSFIDTFPRRFESPRQVVSTFADDEYVGRPHDYWTKYRDRIASITKDDVLNSAKTYLHPDKMVFFVVGKWDEIEPGDADGRASMKEFFEGKVKHLPLRDPLTLEPME